jgi:hypothetical protein
VPRVFAPTGEPLGSGSGSASSGTRRTVAASGASGHAPVGAVQRTFAPAPTYGQSSTAASTADGSVIQRASGTSAASPSSDSAGAPSDAAYVQRVGDDASVQPDPSLASSPALDPERLADDIFRRLRWRLVAERERIFG